MSKMIAWFALDARIIVVAVEGNIKDWAAYIGVVRGSNHAEEWQSVREKGSKLPRQVAEVLFPAFKHLYYRI